MFRKGTEVRDIHMKQRHKILLENGRGMVEILGVLAVIGVLSIGGLYGYQYALHKYNANNIIQDASLAETDLYGTPDNEPFPWTPIDRQLRSDKVIEIHRDNEGDGYVRVQDVDEADCKHILMMANPPRMTLFSEDGKPFTQCAQVNTIIFAFNGMRAPGINCESGFDCIKMNMYCERNNKVCKTCPDGYKINDMADGCDIVCDNNTQTTCELNKTYWCCDKNLLCGDVVGTCLESDGYCEYKVNKQEVEIKSDCSYTISQQTQTIYSDCQYRIENTATGAKYTPIKDCAKGQYCNLTYSDDKCQNGLVNESTGVMYGICSAHNLALTSCRIKTVSNPVKVQKGCPRGQYCRLTYQDESCTKVIEDNSGTHVMYGVCSALSMAYNSCPVQSMTNAVTAIKQCPFTKYCHLTHTDEEYTIPVSNNGAEKLYGICRKKGI